MGLVSGTTITTGAGVAFYSVSSNDYDSIAALDSTHFVANYSAGTNNYGNAIVGLTNGDTTISSYGVVAAFTDINPTSPFSAAVLDSTHFVVAYADTKNSLGLAVIGSISGTTISYGSPLTFNGTTTTYISVSALSSSSFVVAYYNGTTYGTAIIGTVSSGNVIAYGAAVQFSASVATSYISVATLSSSSFVVAWYNATDYGAARVGLISSGTTFSFFTAASSFDGSVACSNISVAAFGANNFVVAYTVTSTGYGWAKANSISGTTITYGTTPVQFSSNATTTYNSVATLDTTHFVVAWYNATDFGAARAGSISGTTITYGAILAFNSATTSYISVAMLDATHFAVAYANISGYGASIVGLVSSGTTITYPNAAVIFNGTTTTNYISIANLDSSHFVVIYNRGGSTSGESIINYSSSGKFVGIVKTTTSSGQSVPVIISGVADGLTGLTPGSIYYVDSNGNLTTTPTSYQVGLGISSSEIQLGNNSTTSTAQFFGDVVFANNFKITEGPGNPEGLIFKNQNGADIFTLNENGDASFTGKLTADTLTIGEKNLVVDSSGNIGIGTATPSTVLEIGSSDLGDGTAGPTITLGININTTDPAAGSINFLNKSGGAGYVWQDSAGNMRVSDSAPSSANDTSGIVIGTQTSTRNTKQDIKDYTDYSDALNMVLTAPLHTFRYKNEVNGYGTDSPLAKVRIGFIADEVDPAFMWGNTIDQVSVNGLLMASIKELNLQIENLNKGQIITDTLGQDAVSFFSDALVKVQDGVAYMKSLVVDALKIGSPEKPTGITLYDEANGNPNCFSIVNGEAKTTLGECAPATALISTTPITEALPPSSDSSTLAGGTISSGDVDVPVITLNGETTVVLDIGATYNEAGAVATEKEGDVAVVVNGSVDTSTAGTYTITYTATDSVGHSATPVTRTVTVGSTTTTESTDTTTPPSDTTSTDTNSSTDTTTTPATDTTTTTTPTS